MESLKILVVDDEARMRKLVKDFLTIKGFTVIEAEDGEQAVDIFFKQKDISLIILDVMMPKMDGWEVLKTVRQYSQVPVIMLTAKTEDGDKITGLTLGADDYIAKPFNPLELVARVKAQLRRYMKYNGGEKAASENIIDFAGLVMNRDTHECIYNERELMLTPIEFDILWLLCENRGKVISSEQLFEQIWKEKYFKNSNNTVMVHIRHLREKMGDNRRKSDFIKTVWGVGYKVEK